MNLTPGIKAHIDELSLFELLERWRTAPVGDPRFQGETGAYWFERMAQLRKSNPAEWVAASKAIG